MIQQLTAFCLAAALVLAPATSQSETRGEALHAALDAARDGDWETAQSIAARLPDQAARDVVEWHRLRAPEGQFPDYLAFLGRNGDWPGLPLMRRRGEASIPPGTPPEQVLAYFGTQGAQTLTGALRLSDALRATGRAAEADALLVEAWRTFPPEPGAEASFLSQYRSLIAPHHEDRLDRLLWDGRTGAARRMLGLVGSDWQALAQARIALREDENGVDALIAAVPRTLAGDPGLAYERYLWRLNKRRQSDAIELLLERSESAESLGRPAYWAARRADLARDLMRDDRDRTAYRIAAFHRLPAEMGWSDYAENEWLAGYIALRKLGDAATALRHFERFSAVVTSPISLGRAGYWEGRALEALGREEEARAAYARGAEHQTSFYGQLAAERAGLQPDPALLGQETYPNWRTEAFVNSSVFQAALLLHEAGERNLTERWLVHMTETLTLPQSGALADLATHLGEPHIALCIAKFVARNGDVLQRPYHPVTDLGEEGLGIHPALALSIARRESEFDPVVISPAGALGLMQVMPRTGRETAGLLGLPFDEARLLSDPAFNARLGSDYIRRQIEDFGPSLALVAAAYNAGPSRPTRWIDRFGDPRRRDVDVIDWIEHVPFTETRNYIMRVTESRVVYGMRLAGRTLPYDVIGMLTGR